MKKQLALAGAAVAALASSALIAPTQAQAASCQGGTGSGRCVEVVSASTSSTVVESVPLVNNSASTVSASCSFGQTVSRSVETSVSVEAGVSAQIVGAVSASVSVGVSQSVSQTASQATTAAGTVSLSPGQSVTCQRTYGFVSATIHQYDYSGSGTSNEKTYTSTVPSSLGATFV